MIPLKDNIRSKSIPFITWSLIASNAFVFYLQLSAGIPAGFERFINTWSVIPIRLFMHPEIYWYTLVTATFLHGSWMHIIGNMIYLYIFGDNVEDRMGHTRYLFFYIIVGVFANGSQAFIAKNAAIPLLGASGAIAGVLGAYFFFYPHAKVMTLIPFFFIIKIIEIPAFFFLGFWFIMQAMNSTSSIVAQMSAKQSLGGVAWLAHASGFVFGLLASPLFGQKRSRFK